MRLPWPTTRSSSFPCEHQTPTLLQINKRTQTNWGKKMFLNITKERQTEEKKPNRRNKHTQRLEKKKMFLNIRRKKQTRKKTK
jgi:hypothetical protein